MGALSESATLPGAVKVEDWLDELFDKSVWSRVTRLVDNAIARFNKAVDPKTGEGEHRSCRVRVYNMTLMRLLLQLIADSGPARIASLQPETPWH